MNPKKVMPAIVQIIRAAAIIAFTVAGSCSPPPTPEPTLPKPTPTIFVRQPIPFGPRVSGVFSGLLNLDDLVTVHIYDENGHEVIYGTHSGNGPWEMIVTNIVPNKDYIVSVEADGYGSQPITYTISIDTQSEQMAEIVSDLDFYFIPNDP